MPAPNGARGTHAIDTDDVKSVVVRRRTRARELALQFLYQWDQRGPEVVDSLTAFVLQGDPDPAVQRFARDLVNGVIEKVADLDKMIIEVAENWEIHRMAVVDRNVLRLSTYELMFMPDIPPKVSINEAIDLAKKYSTAESGAFVNGILDKIRKQCREEQPHTQRQ